MVGEIGVSRSTIDELNSWEIQGDQMEAESGFTRCIIDELHSPDIQLDQMEGESGVPRRYHSRTSFFGYPRRSNGR